MIANLVSSRVRAVLVTFFLLGSAGCAATARFHSKTGAVYPAVAQQAVVCNEQEADIVARAGGIPIGEVSGEGLAVNATEDQVVEKAAIVAGKKGGTHIVLTDRGEETFVYQNPATKERRCTWEQGVEVCDWVYMPATTSTRTEPTARFLVFRVPPEKWAALPQELRPVAND